jgi:hypothetical protein
MDAVQGDLSSQPEVSEIATQMTVRLTEIAGPQHSTDLSIGLAPTQLDALLRGLRLLINAGARGIGDASLDTANLVFSRSKALNSIGWRSRASGTTPSLASRNLRLTFTLTYSGFSIVTSWAKSPETMMRWPDRAG